MREFVDRRPALTGVVIATIAALVARLAWLGERTMHFDEGRVGFRVLEFGETGEWTYDAIVHGPFLMHVDQLLFSVFGATDFMARLPVALIGALLPATAWLFRERLRDIEVIALAGFLAANPVLLYYSRFMRNDVLVATFAFAAFGLGVRLLDTREPKYLYAATVALALAFTTKENALIYLGTWVGALVLVLDYRLFTARRSQTSPQAVARSVASRSMRALSQWRVPIGTSVLAFLAIIVVFYAPRPAFGQALLDPTRLPGVVEEATLGSWREFFGTWGTGDNQDHSYLPFLRDYLQTLRVGAMPVMVLAVLGFVVDRYARDTPTNLVAVAGYWAGASLLIYPLITDIQAPWAAVHTIVPAAIPAAVGFRLLVEQFQEAIAADDAIAAGLAALVVLAVVGQVAVSAATLVYLSPQSDTQIVQFGQPADDFDPALSVVEDVSADNDGTDVMFIGLKFNNDQGSLQFDRLPWPWYLKAMGADVEGSSVLNPLREGSPPPVVIVPADAEYVSGFTESDIEPYMDGYTRIGAYALTLDIPLNVVHAVVYVRTEELPEESVQDSVTT